MEWEIYISYQIIFSLLDNMAEENIHKEFRLKNIDKTRNF